MTIPALLHTLNATNARRVAAQVAAQITVARIGLAARKDPQTWKETAR